MIIYVIKVRSFCTSFVEVVCAYADEESAKKHVAEYEKMYKEDLISDMWYDTLLLKSCFEKD